MTTISSISFTILKSRGSVETTYVTAKLTLVRGRSKYHFGWNVWHLQWQVRLRIRHEQCEWQVGRDLSSRDHRGWSTPDACLAAHRARPPPDHLQYARTHTPPAGRSQSNQGKSVSSECHKRECRASQGHASGSDNFNGAEEVYSNTTVSMPGEWQQKPPVLPKNYCVLINQW